jgi:hypothetical protein
MIKISTDFSRKSQEKSSEKFEDVVLGHWVERVPLERTISIHQTCFR